MMLFNTRAHNLCLLGLMAAYTILCFLVPEILTDMKDTGHADGFLALLVGAAPAYPIAAVLVLYVRHLAGLDELQQKVQLLSLATTSGIILISGTAYGFMVLHLDYVDFPLFLILPAYCVVWAVSGSIIRRRYV